MHAELFSLLGLFLNGVGGLLLVFCPPPVSPREIMPDGTEKYSQTVVREIPESFMPNDDTGRKLKKKLKYYTRLYGFRAGAGFLVVGFLLQLVAEVVRGGN